LGEKVRDGLKIVGVATSEDTASQARGLAIPLTTLDQAPELDLTVDGADEIDGALRLIKGGGGALLREKIVACASRRMIAIVDESKLVDRLGPGIVVPVEIVRFGCETVLDRLLAAEARPRLRRDGAAPFVTDGGNFIADCSLAAIVDGAALEARLKSIVGVVECGLFVGLAAQVLVGRPSGVEVMGR
jgi:ribose 5-phosphate isomerase A